MKKLVNYILIAIMLNWNVTVLAEDQPKGCEWILFEETADYIMENCVGGDGGYQARIKRKNVTNELGEFRVVGKDYDKKENPIQDFKDKVKENPQLADKPDKIEKIEIEQLATQKKVKKVVKEKQLKEKQVINNRENKIAESDIKEYIPKNDFDEKVAEIDVVDTKKPEIKEEIAKKKEDEIGKPFVGNAGSWRQLHDMLPQLIVENEKIKAAEQDYEAAVEMLRSEYSAYKPQITITMGNNWEDDRTPAKGTYPNNTITHDSKQGLQKSITITQLIWDAGRTNSMVEKAKKTAQQTYLRLELVKEDVVIEGINAWLNLKKTYNTWQANKKIEQNAMITLQMTIEKVKKGEGSKLEQLQIEQQYRTYQTLTMTSQLAYDSALQRFENVWRFNPIDIVTMPMPIADLLGILPDGGTTTLNNTTLKIANIDVEIAIEQIKFDEAEFKPRIDGKLSYTEKDGELAGGYDTDSSRKEEWRADITMTWKLFGGFKQKHLTKADRARLRATQIRYADTKRQTDEQFKNAWNNYVLVEKNLETLKRTVEINDEMYKLTLADFKAGNTPIMGVFGMKTAHIMSEVAYENAKLDWLISRFQLHKVLGRVEPIIK